MTTFTPLRWSDTLFCYRLASDPTVREASFDGQSPTWWGHLRWMARHIYLGSHVANVICDGSKRLGIVTGKPYADGLELGISLMPDARGRGVASDALRRWAAMYHHIQPLLPIYARIKLGNTASERAFRAAGFRAQTTIDGTRDGGWVWRYDHYANHTSVMVVAGPSLC